MYYCYAETNQPYFLVSSSAAAAAVTVTELVVVAAALKTINLVGLGQERCRLFFSNFLIMRTNKFVNYDSSKLH